ncbi:MAG: ribosomal protein S18-alanine N-acetyltransferase [Caulobacteraceae bacterium]
MILAPAGVADAADLAAAHAAAFEEGWDAHAIAGLLSSSPGAFALAVRRRSRVSGFILARVAADEAEVLTLAVRPESRRRGIGAALLHGAMAAAAAGDARSVFLEVAADNPAALALYENAGFAVVARRGGYYARQATVVDALVMRRALNR